jgi:hypothetical protein
MMLLGKPFREVNRFQAREECTGRKLAARVRVLINALELMDEGLWDRI